MNTVLNILSKLLLLVTIIGTILSLHWYDTYEKAKKTGSIISFTKHVKSEFISLGSTIKEVTKITGDTQTSIINIKMSSLNKTVEAIEMYHLDNGQYPMNIDNLIGGYISSKAEILQDKTFYYRKIGSNYETEITLPNGEKYVVKN